MNFSYCRLPNKYFVKAIHTLLFLCMHYLSKKLLTILLTLLLGFSPLQSAMAGFTPSADQEEGVYQLMGIHGDMSFASNHVIHNCEQCNNNSGSIDHSCSFSQCASCVSALPAEFFYPANHVSIPVLLPVENHFISQTSTSLFRPPIV